MSTSRSFLRCLLLVGGLALQISLTAQQFDVVDTSGWYIRAGGVARFNVRASISPTVVAPVPGPGNYANGFVLPDVGGSTNLTWNWGYDSQNQVDAVQGQLNYYRYDNIPTLSQQDVPINSPLWGGEIIGGFRSSDFKIGKKPARIAFELGYSYSSFSEGVGVVNTGAASYTTAAYNYNGIILPAPPYAGTPAGPGPLINLNPDSTATSLDSPGGTITALQGSLRSFFHEMRVGPMLEVDLSRKFTVGFGVGYSSVYVDAQFAYSRNVSFANAAIPLVPTATGSVSQNKWRPGGYAEVILAYRITTRISTFLGGDIHYNDTMTFGDSNYNVKIELGPTYQAKAGLSYRF